jgi:CheY-like chemotaxis protein
MARAVMLCFIGISIKPQHQCRFLLYNPVRSESPFPSKPPLRPLFMVDDEQDDRELFLRLVQQSNITHPCRVFGSGTDIIDALIDVLRGATAPLACFIDVRMPGMNGFDVLRWIRCQHALDEIPVIMVSSSEEDRDLTEANHFGAQCYLAKFPTAAELTEIVHEAERVAAVSPANAFKLPCNLLIRSPHLIPSE